MIELLILFELNRRVLTMYGISKEIRATFAVLTTPSYGTIKPALTRLENGGFVKKQKTMSKGGRPSCYYSITKEVKEEQGLSHKRILIPYAFNDELVTEEQLFIFVYPFSNGFNGTMSNNSFSVDIMCPLRYNEINPYGDERIYKILYEIINIFDAKSIKFFSCNF